MQKSLFALSVLLALSTTPSSADEPAHPGYGKATAADVRGNPTPARETLPNGIVPGFGQYTADPECSDDSYFTCGAGDVTDIIE
jgi:hypothetical protein